MRLVGYLGLFVLGIVLVYLGQGHVVKAHSTSAGVLAALGESLLIAVILATVADPFLQRRFAEEWGIGVFWAIFNQDAPRALQEAVNSVAQPDVYVAHAEWRIDLRWTDETHTWLEVEVESHRRLVCVNKDGWHPIRLASGIVPDSDGEPSRFIGMTINARDWTFTLDEDNIESHVAVYNHGAARLDPDDALKSRRVNYRDEVTTATVMQTRMRPVDSIPLFSRYTCLKWDVEVRGPAVGDLFIELFGSLAPAPELVSSADGGRRVFNSKKGDVTFPGYGSVLQWRLLRSSDGNAESDSGSVSTKSEASA